MIGRRAKDVSEADALSHIAGYMLLNDLSARDLQFATPQWMPGKVFDGSAPCGPAMVTPDEAGPPDAIGFALDLNGERMQSSSTDDLIFSIAELVAHLSTLMTLSRATSSRPAPRRGSAATRDPRVWLKPGDEIVISSPTLGASRRRSAERPGSVAARRSSRSTRTAGTRRRRSRTSGWRPAAPRSSPRARAPRSGPAS